MVIYAIICTKVDPVELHLATGWTGVWIHDVPVPAYIYSWNWRVLLRGFACWKL